MTALRKFFLTVVSFLSFVLLPLGARRDEVSK